MQMLQSQGCTSDRRRFGHYPSPHPHPLLFIFLTCNSKCQHILPAPLGCCEKQMMWWLSKNFVKGRTVTLGGHTVAAVTTAGPLLQGLPPCTPGRPVHPLLWGLLGCVSPKASDGPRPGKYTQVQLALEKADSLSSFKNKDGTLKPSVTD